jgi:hypothetical protein
MQLIDRIEKRRFVGREFLVWLWFESEVFDATLATKDQGSFGLWIERLIVLDAGKTEVTRIRGATPATSREAKESLLRGKLPQSAGFHLVWRERESSFTLKAESLGIAGLKLPTVLDEEREEAQPAVLPTPSRRRSRPRSEEQESDEQHEAFYERMHLTRDFEVLIEALYRDFLALRLSAAWEASCVPLMRAWAAGEEGLDVETYRELRAGASSKRKIS